MIFSYYMIRPVYFLTLANTMSGRLDANTLRNNGNNSLRPVPTPNPSNTSFLLISVHLRVPTYSSILTNISRWVSV